MYKASESHAKRQRFLAASLRLIFRPRIKQDPRGKQPEWHYTSINVLDDLVGAKVGTVSSSGRVESLRTSWLPTLLVIRNMQI